MADPRIDKSDEKAILPKPAPGAHLCESTARNAEYWMSEARKINVAGAEKQLCAEQAVNAWKNLAYALARQVHFLDNDYHGAYQTAPSSTAPSETAVNYVAGIAPAHRIVFEGGNLDKDITAYSLAQVLAAFLQGAKLSPHSANGARDHLINESGKFFDWGNAASVAMKNLLDAYERRIRSLCTPEQLEKKPWECAEFIDATRILDAKPNWVIDAADDGTKA